MLQPQSLGVHLVSVLIPISFSISISISVCIFALFANLKDDKNDLEILWSVCVFIFYLCNSRSIFLATILILSTPSTSVLSLSRIYILICLAFWVVWTIFVLIFKVSTDLTASAE